MRSIAGDPLAIGRNRPVGEPSGGRHKRSIAHQPRSRERALRFCQSGKKKRLSKKLATLRAQRNASGRVGRVDASQPYRGSSSPIRLSGRGRSTQSREHRGEPTLPGGGSRVAPAQATRDQPGNQTDPFTATEVIEDSTTDLKRGNCKRCAKLLIEFPNVGFGPRSTDTPARLEVGGPIWE